MIKEESTLLGILYTDGCVSPKGNSWRLYVSNTSFEVITSFKHSLIKVFKFPAKRIRISKSFVNGKPFYKAVVDSYAIGWYLAKKYGTFRTLKYKTPKGYIYPQTDISFMMAETDEIISQFLKVAFACDGGVNLYVARGKYKWLIRNVYLACKHPTLIKQYRDLLRILGIRAQVLTKNWLIRIQGRVDLLRFIEKVGFLEGVNITQNSQYWEGCSKQKILLLLAESYGKPQIVLNLPQFINSKDIVRTL